MKLSRWHYLLPHSFKFSTWGTAVVLVAAMSWNLPSGIESFTDRTFIFWSIVEIIILLPLGWFWGGVFLWPLVSSIVAKVNGAPFHEGDVVQILVGVNRDRIVTVYEVWRERHELRVNLGELDAKDCKDVFSFVEVYRK